MKSTATTISLLQFVFLLIVGICHCKPQVNFGLAFSLVPSKEDVFISTSNYNAPKPSVFKVEPAPTYEIIEEPSNNGGVLGEMSRFVKTSIDKGVKVIKDFVKPNKPSSGSYTVSSSSYSAPSSSYSAPSSSYSAPSSSYSAPSSSYLAPSSSYSAPSSSYSAPSSSYTAPSSSNSAASFTVIQDVEAPKIPSLTFTTPDSLRPSSQLGSFAPQLISTQLRREDVTTEDPSFGGQKKKPLAGRPAKNDAKKKSKGRNKPKASLQDTFAPTKAEIDRRPIVFFDLTIDDIPAGTVFFELFNETVPITAENFRVLATGELGFGYKESSMHRIVSGFVVQGGDFTSRDGNGQMSIYGKLFEDENFLIPHDSPGLLSMANEGPDSNGSQFFITVTPLKQLDGKHVVFGRVHDETSYKLVERINKECGSENGAPLKAVKIINSGQYR